MRLRTLVSECVGSLVSKCVEMLVSERIEDAGVGDEIEDAGVGACWKAHVGEDRDESWRGSRRYHDRDAGSRDIGVGVCI